MISSDEDLAIAAADGDAQAFSSLLDRHYDRVFRLCFRLTGDKTEAEDLCQDICLSLPAKLSGYQRRSKLTTWLYRVTVNASHDRRRKAASYSKATQGWGSWEVGRQAEIAETAKATDWLVLAMRRLSPDLRETLALILDDATHAQAAEVLGVSEGTISWRVSEAKKALKSLKEEEEIT